MHLDELLKRLNETQSLEALQPHWEESLGSLGEGLPSFLTPEEYRENREWCGFGPEVDALLMRRRAGSRQIAACARWRGTAIVSSSRTSITPIRPLRSWPSLQSVWESCAASSTSWP